MVVPSLRPPLTSPGLFYLVVFSISYKRLAVRPPLEVGLSGKYFQGRPDRVEIFFLNSPGKSAGSSWR